MRLLGRIMSALWSTLGIIVIFCAGMQAGQWIGYGKGARDTVRLVIEMRQSSFETPDPWDRGDI